MQIGKMKLSPTMVSYLQVAPLALILIVFLGIPLITVIVVSFFDYANYQVYPDFIFLNYIELFESALVYKLYNLTAKEIKIVEESTHA